MHPTRRSLIASALVALFSLSLSLRAAETAVPTSAPAAPHKLTSTIFNWNQLLVEKKPTGERREVCEGTTPTLAQFRSHVTTLTPHSPWPATEVHTDEELVVIKEGSLEYEINGRIQQAGPGAVILITAGDVHRSHNAGDVPAVYYVFHVVTHEAKAAATK
jgi:mannose-6-phosphate isomerase-like protein (cupin superfamily)